jgi:hypothetical protein
MIGRLNLSFLRPPEGILGGVWGVVHIALARVSHTGCGGGAFPRSGGDSGGGGRGG